MGHAGGHLLFTNSTDAMALLLLGFNSLPTIRGYWGLTCHFLDPIDSKE